MRRVLLTLALVCLPVLTTQAQTLNEIETTTPGNFSGNGGGQIDVQFRGQLQQAIQLTLTGANDGAATTTITNIGPANHGEINFGLVNTQCAWQPFTGECFRISPGIPGAWLVTTFRATVAFSAATGADVGIKRHAAIGGSPPDVQNNRLRFALGIGTGWTVTAPGINMPAFNAPAGENNLGANLPSGSSVLHQVGIRFADAEQAGAYTTTVRWTATIN